MTTYRFLNGWKKIYFLFFIQLIPGADSGAEAALDDGGHLVWFEGEQEPLYGLTGSPDTGGWVNVSVCVNVHSFKHVYVNRFLLLSFSSSAKTCSLFWGRVRRPQHGNETFSHFTLMLWAQMYISSYFEKYSRKLRKCLLKAGEEHLSQKF